jgi:uncharacterized protein YehS (DUF1456 family)
MNNNEVLKKVTIAHNLRRSDILEIFETAGMMYSYAQVGAFLLKIENRKFAKLDDESLEGFLDKLILFSRGSKEQPLIPPRVVMNSIINLAERDMEGALDNLIQCVETAKQAMYEAREKESKKVTEEDIEKETEAGKE